MVAIEKAIIHDSAANEIIGCMGHLVALAGAVLYGRCVKQRGLWITDDA